MFWRVGWPLLSAEGFFCNLDILYGDLGIGKLQFLHVWTLFNKLETIAVQQEILVGLVDKYASFQQENPGAALAQESARVYQLSRSRPCLKEKIPP